MGSEESGVTMAGSWKINSAGSLERQKKGLYLCTPLSTGKLLSGLQVPEKKKIKFSDRVLRKEKLFLPLHSQSDEWFERKEKNRLITRDHNR
mgnify:CR=1 FL=1